MQGHERAAVPGLIGTARCRRRLKNDPVSAIGARSRQHGARHHHREPAHRRHKPGNGSAMVPSRLIRIRSAEVVVAVSPPGRTLAAEHPAACGSIECDLREALSVPRWCQLGRLAGWELRARLSGPSVTIRVPIGGRVAMITRRRGRPVVTAASRGPRRETRRLWRSLTRDVAACSRCVRRQAAAAGERSPV